MHEYSLHKRDLPKKSDLFPCSAGRAARSTNTPLQCLILCPIAPFCKGKRATGKKGIWKPKKARRGDSTIATLNAQMRPRLEAACGFARNAPLDDRYFGASVQIMRRP